MRDFWNGFVHLLTEIGMPGVGIILIVLAILLIGTIIIALTRWHRITRAHYVLGEREPDPNNQGQYLPAPRQWNVAGWALLAIVVCVIIGTLLYSYSDEVKAAMHWQRSPQEAMQRVIPAVQRIGLTGKGDEVPQASLRPQFYVKLPWEMIPETHKVMWQQRIDQIAKDHEPAGTTVDKVLSLTVAGNAETGQVTYAFAVVAISPPSGPQEGRKFDCAIPEVLLTPEGVRTWADELADQMDLAFIQQQPNGGFYSGGANLPVAPTLPTVKPSTRVPLP